MKSYYRFLWKNKLYTAIEIIGMAVAIAFVIIIASFVMQELGYDRQLEGKENIYVSHSERMFIGSPTVKEQLEGKFPEVEEMCRVAGTNMFGGISAYATIDGNSFRQSALIADRNFFRMFTFPLVYGDPETILEGRNSVAVSESFARMHFREKDPVGQSFEISVNGNRETVTVCGVYKDFKNTVFPAQEMVYNCELFGEMHPDANRNGYGLYSLFFRIVPGSDTDMLARRMEDIVKENDMLYSSGIFRQFRLSPFEDIHFGIVETSMPFEGIVSGDFIRLFIAAGIMLLVFALLNYISLTVAQTGFRAKEMATRRLLGSQKMGIVARYIAEAAILTAISFFLAIVFSELFAAPLSGLIGKDVSPLSSITAEQIAFCIFLFVILSLFAGIVPAIIVSRYEPVAVVKGLFAKSTKMVLGKIFMAIQNFATVAMIAFAFAMFLQLRYMGEKPMGYEKQNIISVTGAYKAEEYAVDELRGLACVEKVGWVQWNPIHQYHDGWGATRNGELLQFDVYFGDMEAFETLGFKVIRQNSEPLSGKVWMMESSMRALGLNYDSEFLPLDDGRGLDICGYIGDYTKGNAESINEYLSYFEVREMRSESDFGRLRELAVKVRGDEDDAVRQIRDFYTSRGFTEDEFQVISYNDLTRALYSDESRDLKLIGVLTALVLLLSAMALLAMSTYYMKQHAKETAVRKVMGCSRLNIYLKTAEGFLATVLAAAAIAIPFSWEIVRLWLESYSYRISNYWWLYIAAVVVVAIMAVLSVSWQAVRLMNTDPVEALKSE